MAGAAHSIDVEEVLAESQRTAEESASASSQASSVVMSVRMVHGMMGEMMRGIDAVETHVSESRRRILKASGESNKAQETVAKLSRAVDAIASTANLIDRIASATNMLALNATIEAARAGELGRGFTVVANEVKSLAQQTAQATEGVQQQLETIRQAKREVMESVGVLNENLTNIQAQVDAVSAAVSEHNSSLGTVSGFAKEAADTVEGIAATLDRIAEAARTTSERIRQFNALQTL
jgi:methyl-accepting chemotaxis protein